LPQLQAPRVLEKDEDMNGADEIIMPRIGYLKRAVKQAKGTGIKLAIVGKDPFPTNPVYIPFCKPSWKEQARDSGRYVLESLGFEHEFLKKLASAKNYKVLCLRDQFKDPISLFESLLLLGIVFLNYFFVKINGEVKKDPWVIESLKTGLNRYEAVRPDVRNRISRYQVVKIDWHRWWTKDAILKKLKDVDITFPELDEKKRNGEWRVPYLKNERF
jgi:hypothetical protein